MNNFNNIDKVYIIGIGGIGISALARYFKAAGKLVAGYDLTRSELTNTLENEGIIITYSDDIKSVPQEFLDSPKDTMVIYTPAVPQSNTIFSYFATQGYTIHKRAKVLGMIANNYTTIAISGTHGKTTNSCVIANIIRCAQKDGFAFLGGISNNLGSNLMLPENKERYSQKDTLLVAEADEYDRSFLWLNPKVAVITYVDADHLDIYKDRNDIVETFNKFASQCEKDGVVIVNKQIDNLINTNGIRKMTYSETDNSSDYYAQNIRLENGVYTIDVATPKGVLADVRIGAKGRVNVENTVACVAAAQQVGIDDASIKDGISTFRGVKRRMEYHVQKSNLVYIDDYAHHPREIAATIKSVKELFPAKKLFGIFQPHLYTRTRDFAQGFAESLDMLDELILMDIYPAREKPIPGVDSQMIATLMHHCKVSLINDPEKIIKKIVEERVEVLLTLGAGNIDRLIEPITKALL